MASPIRIIKHPDSHKVVDLGSKELCKVTVRKVPGSVDEVKAEAMNAKVDGKLKRNVGDHYINENDCDVEYFFEGTKTVYKVRW